VTELIYINLLLDTAEWKEAVGATPQLAVVLTSLQNPDLELANRIAGVRLLYLRHRIAAARSAALAVFPAVRALDEGQGLCEWILACRRDLLGADPVLGAKALRLVTEILPHTVFQASRAVGLLSTGQPVPAASHLDRDAVLNEIQTLLRSEHGG